MGWIRPEDMMPPQGLQVLLEVSGLWCGGIMSDHEYELGSWIIPDGKTEGYWFIHGAMEYCGRYYELIDPIVHAWMPLPKHFQPQEIFGEPEDDMMEHPMFTDDPEWLYKGDCVYEQMSLEDFMGMEASADDT